jgi:hypothetical protein
VLPELTARAHSVIESERSRLTKRADELGPLSHQLRQLLEQIESELRENARRLRELDEHLGRAPQLPIDALDDELFGRRLREVAVEVLRQHRSEGQPIHYRQWLELVLQSGVRVGGKNPAATFLTQITKAEDIESVRPRSGLYRLKAS